MEVYRYLPGTEWALARNTLKGIHSSVTKAPRPIMSHVTARVDVLKLAICSLIDFVVTQAQRLASSLW